jgi:hypothetical protein
VFAEQGHRVTFVDRDTDLIAARIKTEPWAKACTVVTQDLEDGASWSLGRGCFDVLVVSNYLYRPHLPDLFAALAEGGVLLYETFALGNEVFGRPRSPEFLLRPGELLEQLPGEMSVIAYEHGMEQRSTGLRVIQRLCAQWGQSPKMLAP